MGSPSKSAARRTAPGDRSGLRLAGLIAIWAALPIVAIDVLGRLLEPAERRVLPISVDATTFGALRTALTSRAGYDSWVPMQEALQAMGGPGAHTLYETLFFGSHVRFQYPPMSLLPFAVLAKLGLANLQALNTINLGVLGLEALAVAALAWLLFTPPAPSAPQTSAVSPNRAAMAALALALTFQFYPVIRAQVLGQIQLWIDLLFAAALIAWTLGRRGAAGVLIGVACAIKPQLGLLLVWALLWREWRFALGVVVGVAPLVAISVGLYGLHNHLEYLSVLSYLSRHGESFFPNNSVNGILNWYLSGEDSLRWHSNEFPAYNPIVYIGTMVATLVFLAAIVLPPLLSRGRRADLSDLGAAAICTVIASPIAWEHHYGILLPIFGIALKQALDMPDKRLKSTALAILVLSWVLVADFIPFAFFLSRTAFVVVQGYCFFGAQLLLAVLLLPRAGRPDVVQPVGVAA